MGQDIWLPNYATNGPKLRVRITYNYSDIQKYQALEDQWKEMLDADINEYEWINTYLEQIQQPFEMISKNQLRGLMQSPNQETRD